MASEITNNYILKWSAETSIDNLRSLIARYFFGWSGALLHMVILPVLGHAQKSILKARYKHWYHCWSPVEYPAWYGLQQDGYSHSAYGEACVLTQTPSLCIQRAVNYCHEIKLQCIFVAVGKSQCAIQGWWWKCPIQLLKRILIKIHRVAVTLTLTLVMWSRIRRIQSMSKGYHMYMYMYLPFTLLCGVFVGFVGVTTTKMWD